ncbi:helix-turn-helix domain-containing protein [Bacillus pakistanensis]|uniref:helix-turn-helix domain-containing protein n=1 Tax=Rossellomorea pakistanensis TaxID=992288 RepID=UPI001EF960A8|nr:helix-turn-helix domain-containing protein [Bacillus pakistanensis]
MIKFHREEAGLTQGQLAQGICSVTHLSKIERGITEYSHEITDLLANKLEITMDSERSRYRLLQEKLEKWNNAIIMVRSNEIHQLKNEIEIEPLRFLADFKIQYNLILARYYLFVNEKSKTKEILETVKDQYSLLSPYEQNFLKHVEGIYLFLMENFKSCIEILKQIDHDYPNEEFYYHLAIAYHSIRSNIFAYYYGRKALQFFQKTLNILRIIDTETLILVQLNSKEPHDMEETKQQYEKLLKVCESVNSIDRASKIHHNLAFEYFRRKRYSEAKQAYEKALELITEEAPHYLISLSGYISTCYRGGLLPKAELINLSKKGLKMAKQNQDPKLSDFVIHLHTINQSEKELYEYIEKTALPNFIANGDQFMKQHYEKKLFLYYVKTDQKEKAFQLAADRMISEKSYYDLE